MGQGSTAKNKYNLQCGRYLAFYQVTTDQDSSCLALEFVHLGSATFFWFCVAVSISIENVMDDFRKHFF